ncbi:MAG: secondary thiamine-phosphate synthase enzyme YjbQ [Gammaproteobacteria bacterium]
MSAERGTAGAVTIHTDSITCTTRGRGCYELSAELDGIVAASGARDGLCSVFIRHTSASLMVCENADAEVLRDLERYLSRLVPDGDALFRHDAEGPDDMPAHVRSVLTQSALTLPVRGGRLALGTWQGVFLYEHRTHAHRREMLVTVLG